VAGSGTAAWLPKRPEQVPASVSGPRFASPKGAAERERPTHGRSTRPFRFGSEDRPDPDPPLDAGALVGERYKIVRLLGEGGMGRVYEAEHTVLSRRVALKLLRRDAQAQADNLARFRQEALAASRIGTAQIVEIVDFASHTGPAGVQTYMVMELLAGESLEDWMDRNERLDIGVELLAQLCEGLAAAHRAGVIHRDIKPANVFCQTPERGGPSEGYSQPCPPRVKILDFGIAKMTAGEQGVHTQQGSLLGTPYYLAPERVMGATSQLTPATDVYSVGVILYEMLTGNVPFVADSFMGILARHVHAEPLDPRQAAPDRAIPDSIASLCMRLLAKQPSERPSAAELEAELRGLLARERQALSGVRVGPREGTSGTGEDTQVLAAGEAEQSVSERPTLPPAMDSFAGAARPVGLGEPTPRGRSGTAIGHAAVASQTSAIVRPSVPSSPMPTPTRASPAPVIAAVVVVLLGGLGVGSFALWRSRQSDEPAATDEVPVAEAPVVEAPPSLPEDAAPRVEPPAIIPKAIEPAPAEPPPVAEPSPDTAVKPAVGPSKKQEPAAEPQPEPQPEPESPPSEPDPAPTDAQVDPQLPTIKDDVYE
jgi:serine/threonine protein kinase